MNNLQDFTRILNTIILIFLGIGGYMAFRAGKARTANEVQDRVINAMQHELDLQAKRIDEGVKGIRGWNMSSC